MYIGLIIVVVVLIFVVFRASTTHFVCPNCGKSFKVGILKYILAPHAFNKRLARCPHCGHEEMLAPVWNKK